MWLDQKLGSKIKKGLTVHSFEHPIVLSGDRRYIHSPSFALGFTLIELMVTVAMIAILAAIAIPSYQYYVIKNAESNAKAQMKTLAIELEKWRATNLSYRGFYPSTCSTDPASPDTLNTSGAIYENCYDNPTTNTTLYVPKGSNASNFRYQIVVTDYADTSKSLIPVASTNNPNLSQPALGRAWAMVATANSNLRGAPFIYLDSRGIACSTTNSTLTASDIASGHNCGTTAVSNW